MADEYIRKEDAIDTVSKACFELRGVFGRCEDALKALPPADVTKIVDANTVNITVMMMSSVVIGVIMSIWQEK